MVRRAVLTVAAAVVIVTGVVVATRESTGAAERLDVTIRIEVDDSNARVAGASCNGWDVNDVVGQTMRGEPLDLSFNDLYTGSQVVVRDQVGTIVGKGELSAGAIVRDNGDAFCQWGSALDIPTDRPFYQLQVGWQPPRAYRQDELADDGWTVDVELTRDAGDEPA